MSAEDLEPRLETLLAPDAPTAPSRAEFDAVMAHYDAQFGESPTKTRPRRPWLRWLAPILGAGALVGACALPASYEVDLGVGLHLDFAAGEEPPVHAMAEFCKSELGAKDITVEMSISKRGEAGAEEAFEGQMDLELWGPGLEPGEVVTALEAAFPELEDAPFASERLEGRVRTNLGGKLLHEYFDRVADEEDLELAKSAVLAELRARGVEGEVDVDVSVDGDRRELRIGVRQIEMDPPP